MNRNTVFAFALILVAAYIFNSRWYYDKILRRPYPYDAHDGRNDPAALGDGSFGIAAAGRLGHVAADLAPEGL